MERTPGFIFALAAVCIGLSVIAISARAGIDNQPLNQSQPVEIEEKDLSLSYYDESDPVQTAIHDMFTAIRTRQADLAYEFLSADYKEKSYKNAGSFLNQLRFDFRALYNHQSYTFGDKSYVDQNRVIQKVNIKSMNGDIVKAIYKLERNENGIWQIDAFSVLSSETQPI